MHKSIYWVVGIWLALALFLINNDSRAETRTYQDSSGQIVGSSFTMGNMTFYQDRTGRQVGSATTMDNFTFYSAPDGRYLGNSYTMPNSNNNRTQSQPNPFIGGTNGR